MSLAVLSREDDQVPLIVLMGASGAGKTSLLRAGLTDILKDKKIKSDSEERNQFVVLKNEDATCREGDTFYS